MTLWTKLPLMEIRIHIKIRMIPKTHSSHFAVSTMMIEISVPVEISPAAEGLSSPAPPKTPSYRNCD